MSNVTEYVSGSPGTTELRKTSNSTANAFVTVTYSYEMESKGFAQLFSYPCNGLNPAAGFWRFFFIDSAELVTFEGNNKQSFFDPSKY